MNSSRFSIRTILMLLLTSFIWWGSALAQQPVVPKLNVPKHGSDLNPSAATYVKLTFEAVEIVTTKESKHYWQVAIQNHSNKPAKKVKAYVQALGYRSQDKSQVIAGEVPVIDGGQMGYIRGPLPNFEGMHQLYVRAPGTNLKWEIPRPFRKDNGGQPQKGLTVKKTYTRMVNGKLMWFLETGPNIYAPIPARKVGISVMVRGRTKVTCPQEDNAKLYYAGEGGNDRPIPSGQTYLFSGEFQRQAMHPGKFDNIVLILNNEEHYVRVPESFHSGLHYCDEKLRYP